MCNLGMAVEMKGVNRGLAQGITQGITQGIAQGISQGKEQALLESIKKMIKNLGLTTQQAMNALEIPKNDQAHYAELLKENEH